MPLITCYTKLNFHFSDLRSLLPRRDTFHSHSHGYGYSHSHSHSHRHSHIQSIRSGIFDMFKDARNTEGSDPLPDACT